MSIETTNWHWQQWYFIVVWALMIVLAPVLHGEKKTGEFNGLIIIFNVVSAFLILYSAGFFK